MDPPLVRENLVEHTELIFKCAFFLFPFYLILADTERLPLTTAEARSETALVVKEVPASESGCSPACN